MKRHHRKQLLLPRATFSALGRAVWDETIALLLQLRPFILLSVLSVEPYGMKQSP